MEFLFPLLVLALGGTMFFFRWRARQRRRLYGSSNDDSGISAMMMGMSGTTMGSRSSHASDADTAAAAGAASGHLGDGYSGPSSDGGGSSASGSDGGGGSGGGGT